jgi:hypothetical protein
MTTDNHTPDLSPGLRHALEVINAERGDFDAADELEGFVRGAAFMLDKLCDKLQGTLNGGTHLSDPMALGTHPQALASRAKAVGYRLTPDKHSDGFNIERVDGADGILGEDLAGVERFLQDQENSLFLVRFYDQMNDRLRWGAGVVDALLAAEHHNLDQCDVDAISCVREQLREAEELLEQFETWRKSPNSPADDGAPALSEDALDEREGLEGGAA